jgi:hypothetical protein
MGDHVTEARRSHGIAMTAAETIARLGLHVVEADDVTLRDLALGWYAVPTREAVPVADALVGPCDTRDGAALALVARLAELARVRAGLAVDAGAA